MFLRCHILKIVKYKGKSKELYSKHPYMLYYYYLNSAHNILLYLHWCLNIHVSISIQLLINQLFHVLIGDSYFFFCDVVYLMHFKVG